MSVRNEEQRSVTQITKAAVIIFAMLVGSYVLILWLLGALHAVSAQESTWWIALVVVLALGGAAGLGYSYQVLRLIGARDILQRLSRIPAASIAQAQPQGVTVTEGSRADTVREIRAELEQDLIPVVNEADGKLDGVVTSTDLAKNPDAASVGEIMTRGPAVASGEDSLADVLFLMRTSGHDNIPVVDGEQKYVGTVTPRAMLEALQGGPERPAE